MQERMAIAARVLTLLTALIVASTSAAQTSAAAQALFEQGRRAMSAGNYEAASSHFRESDRIEPTVGAKLNLAECEYRRGKLATAWELFRAVTMQVGPEDPRMPIASARVAEIEPRLPRLTLRLARAAPRDTTVRLGQLTLGPQSFDVPLPVDPGPHRLVITAPGRARHLVDLSFGEGQQQAIEVAPGAPMTQTPQPPPSSPAPSFWARHRGSVIVGGVAVLFAGVGVGVGASTSSSYSDLAGSCGGTATGCSQDEIDSVERKALATNLLLGAAAVAAATSVVLFLFVEDSGEPEAGAAIMLVPTPTGASLLAHF